VSPSGYRDCFPDSSLLGDKKMVNGHKSAAHTDSPDGCTGKTCIDGGMHSPSASSYGRPMYGAIIFLPCSFFLSIFFYLSFFPRLISAATDWMSTILVHTAWP